MKWPLLARAGAIAVAIAALVDPAFTDSRRVPVRLGIVAPEGGSVSSLGGALNGYTLVDGATPDAQALVVIARDGAPLPYVPPHARVFVMRDAGATNVPRIERLDAPPSATLGRTVFITARVRKSRSAEPVVTSLFAGGRLAAREEMVSAETEVDVRLSFVAAAAGLTPLRVEVRQGDAAVEAATAIHVRDTRLRVLFEDAQPSWGSTFVRRALEQEPAFDVSAATTAARGIRATIGAAVDLDDAAARERVDVLVIGAPSAAGPAALARAGRFARERGGAVVVLADADAGPALARLTGVAGWRRRTLPAPAAVSGAQGTMRAADVVTALSSPAAVALASLATGEPIVLDIPLGAGRIIVSGAVDAWRYRGADGGSFARFWRTVIGDAAESAARPLRVTAQPVIAQAGEEITVEVAIRDAVPGQTIEARASLDGVDATPIRLWPAASPGVFTGRVRAPATPGEHRIRVSTRAAGAQAALESDTAVSIATGLALPAGSHADVTLTTFASAHSGSYIADGSPQSLRAALDDAFAAHTAEVDIHPMRSAWWLLPFVLGLGLEWKWRRERGLR